jgi:PTH2 family peptidyl-tRNA hydrolase
MSDIKQVIVMRNDLNMRKGKMIAQGAHAAMMFMTRELDRAQVESRLPLWTETQLAWMQGSFKKIAVRAESEAELMRIYDEAKAAGLDVHICIDSGKTEFNGVPTKTCLAIGPDHAEKIDAITGDLKLL